MAQIRYDPPSMAAQVSPVAAVAKSGNGVGLRARLRRATPWWAQPLAIVVALGAFTVYSIWTSFFGPGPNHVSEHANYLSPFFSPLIASISNLPAPGMASHHLRAR